MVINNRKKLTKEEFINRSNDIHDFKYKYDKVEYYNNKKKVIITCKDHGDFLQIPKSHLKSSGCPMCYGRQLSNTGEFIGKSNIIHNNKYTYDKSEYINIDTGIIITCREHGDFTQIPKSHLNGFGCKKCSGLERLSTNDFIERSNIIHDSAYNYEKSNYINIYTKVIIICKNHGEFSQVPYNHLRGMGCRKCKIESMFLTNDIFLQKCKKLHGDLYDYTKTNYIDTGSIVAITCKCHGDFYQTPHAHLAGHGCYRCNNSRGENNIENILKNKNIKYKTQYTFDNLKHINLLRFDFGIFTEENILNYIIEYNGNQHYEFVEYFHKNENRFIESKKRDKIKLEYCDTNNIPLYVIRHDEDIENRINEIINSQNDI